jgi:hypothetical protein
LPEYSFLRASRETLGRRPATKNARKREGFFTRTENL